LEEASANSIEQRVKEAAADAFFFDRLFTPYAQSRREKLYPSRSGYAQFVHYTSAEAALKIINGKRFWLRNTSCMGDYREVQHGFDTLRSALASEGNEAKLSAALDRCSPGLAKESFGLFNQWWEHIRTNTYIGCLSEHDIGENDHGRLSMWRAFGGGVARVGVVLNVPWYSGGVEALNLIFSPVAYFGEGQVRSELAVVIHNIHANIDVLRRTGRGIILGRVANMLMAAVTCMKHEGFHEEKEWRVLCNPKMLPSPLVQHCTQSIAGVPQIVYEMPLDVTASDKLSELDVSKLVSRVIIGPTQYPSAIAGAFVEAMARAGIPDPEAHVCASGIPIRM
jgi:hypothetical protein